MGSYYSVFLFVFFKLITFLTGFLICFVIGNRFIRTPGDNGISVAGIDFISHRCEADSVEHRATTEFYRLVFYSICRRREADSVERRATTEYYILFYLSSA